MLPTDLRTLPAICHDPEAFDGPEAFDAPPAERDGFPALGLPSRLVRTLARAGITEPFEIQTVTIPDALAGHDILGRAPTGSGKTLAFGLPTLTRLATARAGTRGAASAPHRPRGLVLVPTRELARQVADALAPLARVLRLWVGTATGGGSYDQQINALARGVDIMVATPGRLADLIERGACDLGAVEITVVDEADRLADMGFLPEVTALLAQTPAAGQRMLFSATLDADVEGLVQRFLTDPVSHAVGPTLASVDTMAHHLLVVPPRQKFTVAASIAARSGRTIMFVRTQLAVDRLAAGLAEVGVRAGALHAGKTQRVRTRTLAAFRDGTVQVLVATDVAARGIHVDDVSLVVHVDPPADAKDYLHRAGRTARAGSTGTVVTLVLPKQRKSTAALVARAGVAPRLLKVQPGDPALAGITGARPPSGVPVPAQPPPAPDVRRSANTRPARRAPDTRAEQPARPIRRPDAPDRRVAHPSATGRAEFRQTGWRAEPTSRTRHERGRESPRRKPIAENSVKRRTAGPPAR